VTGRPDPGRSALFPRHLCEFVLRHLPRARADRIACDTCHKSVGHLSHARADLEEVGENGKLSKYANLPLAAFQDYEDEDGKPPLYNVRWEWKEKGDRTGRLDGWRGLGPARPSR